MLACRSKSTISRRTAISMSAGSIMVVWSHRMLISITGGYVPWASGQEAHEAPTPVPAASSPGRFGTLVSRFPEVVGSAALPRRTAQRGVDRVDQAAVGIGDDQPHPGQATRCHRAQEGEPAGATFLRGHVHAENFARRKTAGSRVLGAVIA